MEPSQPRKTCIHSLVTPRRIAPNRWAFLDQWYERLPHFRMNFTPSSGAELQSEYFVPRDKGYAAILAVEQLRDQITPHLFITEFRTIAADDLWNSPCYQRPSMTIHFTWKPEWPEVKKVLPLIEEKLAPFGGRPHWAKLFTMQPARLRAQYAKMHDYQAFLRNTTRQENSVTNLSIRIFMAHNQRRIRLQMAELSPRFGYTLPQGINFLFFNDLRDG